MVHPPGTLPLASWHRKILDDVGLLGYDPEDKKNHHSSSFITDLILIGKDSEISLTFPTWSMDVKRR